MSGCTLSTLVNVTDLQPLPRQVAHSIDNIGLVVPPLFQMKPRYRVSVERRPTHGNSQEHH